MDQLLIEVAKPVVKKSWKEIMLAKDLDSDMKALKEKRAFIQAALADAQSSGSCSSRTQELTLDKLKHALERIDDFFDKRATRADQKKVSGGGFRTEVRLFFSSSNPLFSLVKDAHKVKDFRKELDLIVNNKATLGNVVVNMVSEEKKIQLPTGPFPNTNFIGGRDVERNDLVSKLCNSSNDQESLGLSIVTIVGIGGQGKTTLAQYVYNDQRVIDYFGVRIWVFATPNISLEDLLKNIIAHATDEKPSVCEMSQLQDRIVKAIKGNKFLLVLDNIWDQDKLKENWEQLRILLQHGDSGSKVLVTTRCKEVARIMGSPDAYMLNDLTEENAWPLFQHFAFKPRQEPRVEAIGEEIFKMCPKIPLVLKVIGQHLREECHTIDHWRAVKDALAKKSSFKVKDMIMGTLKLSYDRLSEKLKPCVVYCSLFPKGTIYDAEKMVRLWIALGYVEAEDKSLEDEGQDYVQMLANRSFFHVVKDKSSNIMKFAMHDVIHDLMLWESKSRYKMVDSETTEIDENICHVSFLRSSTKYEFDWDDRYSVCTVKQRLKSILMVNSGSGHPGHTFKFRSGYDELIRRFQGLKVLDIHGLRIWEVPTSLGKLIHLRYLDLSGNYMDRLPKSITQLVNLLSLDLSHCYNLEELPKDFNKLYKLRHLRLYKSSLTYMPKGLGKLKDLQTLDWFIVGHVKGNVMGGLDELSDLVNLKGQLIITVAVESKYIVSQGRIAPLGRKDKLTKLDLEFEEGAKEDEMVLEHLRPQGEKLKRMKIFGYGGSKLPSWMMNEQLHYDLPNLRLIWMNNDDACIYNWTRMPASECGPWLKIDLKNGNLLLESMPGFIALKKQLIMNALEVGFNMPNGAASRGLTLRKLIISEQLAASQSFQQHHRIFFKTWFPKLRKLYLRSIPELVVLPEEFRDLSFLETLEFCFCPKLKALPDWLDTLTSLKRIYLKSCPAIETLPHQISNLSRLVKLYFDVSEVLVERCRKPSGELWPFIQHIDSIHLMSSYGSNPRREFKYSRNEQ